MRSFRFAVLAFASSFALSAPTFGAVKSWTGHFPTKGSVTIPAGDTVTLDTDVTLTDLTVNGTLLCGKGNLRVSANWIMVHGKLQCGTPADPFLGNLTITLNGALSSQDVMGMGTKFIGAMGGGEIALAGENRTGWTRLAVTARRGAAQISVADASSWRVGDRIVIVSTDYRSEHAEERTIKAKSGNTLSLSSPLAYEHWCAKETYGPHVLEQCAEIGLLTRNIVIKGDSQSATAGFGGHLMAMSGSSLKISGVQFEFMGQKGRIARYPVHWHLAGDAAGDYLDNSSIVHSYNRFVSVHGTHNVRLSRNVGYDTIGHGYYLEDGIERGNVIEDNLGVLVKSAKDGLPTASDRQASVFWISNPDNIIRRNVAAGSDNTGFWLGFPEHPIGLSSTTTVWPRRTPLKLFKDNVSHSNFMRGLFVDGGERPDRTTTVTWYAPVANPADPNSPKVPPVFENFTAYKNRFEGVWLRSFSNPVLKGAKLADNFMGAYFASLSGTPGYIRDSLVVGETGNKGNTESWEVKGLDGRELPHFWKPDDSLRGLEFYDGPMAIETTVFANFQSNSQRKSGALTSLSPNPFWVSARNTSDRVSFRNANQVWLDPNTPGNNGDGFSIFRDIDGSVTGVPHQRVVPKNPVLVTPACILKGQWNAYVCRHNYVGVQILTTDGVNLSGMRLQRDDGASHILRSAVQYPTTLHFNVIENRIHHLTPPVTMPRRVTFVRQEGMGEAARLSLPYPASAFTVTLWGYPVAKAGSLSDLSSGGTKYFYDSSKQILHLRLVSSNGKWESYEVKRP